MFEAIFTEMTNTITITGLNQWDRGISFKIKGLNLERVVEVHFENIKLGVALIRWGVKDENGDTIVAIPNDILTMPHDFKAWVVETDEKRAKTIRTVLFPLVLRAQPADYVFVNDDATFNALNELTEYVNLTYEEIKQIAEDTANKEAQFEADITKQQTDFEADITQRQTTFETGITKRQDDYEKETTAQIDQRLSSVYRPCGSVATKEELPTDAKVGDVYDVLESGVNWVWTGEKWDSLAGNIDLSNYYTKEQTDTKLDKRLKIVEIISPVDIRTLLEDGIYHISDYGVATQCTNMPILEAGTLEVRKAGNAITQSFRPYKYNDVYYQGYNAYDNVWFPWEKHHSTKLEYITELPNPNNDKTPRFMRTNADIVVGDVTITKGFHFMYLPTNDGQTAKIVGTNGGDVLLLGGWNNEEKRWIVSLQDFRGVVWQTKIMEPIDFNTLTQPGLYVIRSSEIMKQCTNRPSERTGSLLVSGNGGSIINQTFFPVDTQAIVRRNKMISEWYGWAVIPIIVHNASTKTLDIRW